MKKQQFVKKLSFSVVLLFTSLILFSQNNDELKDKCIIVLDVQNYTTTNSKLPCEELINNINSIVRNVPPENVVYIKTVHKVLYLSLKGFSVGLDTLGMEFDNRLQLVSDNIFSKEQKNTFSNVELINFLESNKFKDIIIIGFMAEYCVEASLLGGKKLHYNMYYLPEAIMGKSEKKKEKVFKKLDKKGIKKYQL